MSPSLNRTTGKEFRPKQSHIQTVSKGSPILKFNFDQQIFFISNSTKFITNSDQNLQV